MLTLPTAKAGDSWLNDHSLRADRVCRDHTCPARKICSVKHHYCGSECAALRDLFGVEFDHEQNKPSTTVEKADVIALIQQLNDMTDDQKIMLIRRIAAM